MYFEHWWQPNSYTVLLIGKYLCNNACHICLLYDLYFNFGSIEHTSMNIESKTKLLCIDVVMILIWERIKNQIGEHIPNQKCVNSNCSNFSAFIGIWSKIKIYQDHYFFKYTKQHYGNKQFHKIVVNHGDIITHTCYIISDITLMFAWSSKLIYDRDNNGVGQTVICQIYISIIVSWWFDIQKFYCNKTLFYIQWYAITVYKWSYLDSLTYIVSLETK